MTGDDHGQLDPTLQRTFATVVEARGGRMTFYLARFGRLTAGALQTPARGRPRGRPAPVRPPGRARRSPRATRPRYNWFTTTQGGGYGQPSRTERNHQVEWQGWADAAKVAQARPRPMEMSDRLLPLGRWLRKPDGQYVCSGYPTGSGLPMQFVDQAGALVPVYQQTTQLVDEMMLSGIASSSCELTAAAGGRRVAAADRRRRSAATTARSRCRPTPTTR